MNNTIVAISTAQGVGAISIIRLSGNDCISLVNSIFKGKDLTKVETHTINYGYIHDNNNIIDEVLVSIMRAPKTYTKEDVVEINCHGGIATTKKILELIISKGATLAEPGEFTKRAFLNGRIDLIEAEGIMNIIESKTDKARSLAINQITASVSKKIEELRETLIKIISNIAVNIDYPEYEDITEVTNDIILPEMLEFKKRITKLIHDSETGKIINVGINVGIIGKPNVGKSSLLNYLLEEDKAIVTDIPGTTRDIVEGQINLNGIILNIIDTAGIRETNDLVEQIGVNKSKEIINKSDLVILILNNNTPLEESEKELLNILKNKKHLILVNKTDLPTKIDLSLIPKYINISIKDNLGLEELKQEILKLFNLEEIETEDLTYLTNANSIGILENVSTKVDQIINDINNNLDIDIIEFSLKEIWNQLGEIIGVTYKEEFLDEMFNRFCLGK